MQQDEVDYGEYSDEELADELTQTDKDIEYWQKSIASQRRLLNRAMESREELLDVIKERGQRRGWKK
jgi:hypothetical protein